MLCLRRKFKFLLIIISLTLFLVLRLCNTGSQSDSDHQTHLSRVNFKPVPTLPPLVTTFDTTQKNRLQKKPVDAEKDSWETYFTDLLQDFEQKFKRITPGPAVDELAGKKSSELKKEMNVKIEVPAPVAVKPEQKVEKSTSWLFNDPNVIVYPTVTEDVMPDYFDPDSDQISQFERYHEETAAIITERLKTAEAGCVRVRQYIKDEQNFIFYFPEFNIGWCPVFKAASTNWKQFFCKIYRPEVYEEWRLKTDNDPYCPLGELLDFSIRKQQLALKEYMKNHKSENNSEKIKELMSKIDNAVKFMTVRHPYERLVSMYTNKFENCISKMFSNEDGAMTKIFKKYREVGSQLSDEEKDVLIEEARIECRKPVEMRKINKNNPYMNPMGATFREVMLFIIDNYKHGVWPDFHWIQVTKSCDICSKDYAVIEKFETLERDHYYLLKTIGEEARYPGIAGLHSNPSLSGRRDPRELVDHYFSQIDKYILWDLYTLYKDDFTVFGYKPHYRLKKNPYAH